MSYTAKRHSDITLSGAHRSAPLARRPAVTAGLLAAGQALFCGSLYFVAAEVRPRAARHAGADSSLGRIGHPSCLQMKAHAAGRRLTRRVDHSHSAKGWSWRPKSGGPWGFSAGCGGPGEGALGGPQGGPGEELLGFLKGARRGPLAVSPLLTRGLAGAGRARGRCRSPRLRRSAAPCSSWGGCRSRSS